MSNETEVQDPQLDDDRDPYQDDDEEAEATPKPMARVSPSSANVGTKKKEDEEDDVLDLTDAVPTRKLVRVPVPGNAKGEVFELRLLDDFGVIEQQQLLSWSRRFEALWNKEDKDLTAREQQRMKWLLNKMFQHVLDAPTEVKASVPDVIKSRVVTAFTMVPLLERQRREAKREEEEEMSDDQSSSGS